MEALFKGFDAHTVKHWMEERMWLPWTIAVAYVIFVFVGQAAMKNKEPLKLKGLFTIWNFILSVFSILGGSVLVTKLLTTLSVRGERYVFCTSGTKYFFDGAEGFWMSAFILSKIPELVDTIFLVLQKKPVIFLHWYHHWTVMLYCWYAFVYPNGTGLAFAGMNYFVHAIMYTYYFCMNFSNITRQIVRPFAQLITLLQLAQMAVGLYITAKTQLYLDGQTKNCNANWHVNFFGLLMYLSYFVLFGHFFHKNYIAKTGKKRGAESAKKVQ
jgi:elongation of very long chain fatty acids protein 6